MQTEKLSLIFYLSRNSHFASTVHIHLLKIVPHLRLSLWSQTFLTEFQLENSGLSARLAKPHRKSVCEWGIRRSAPVRPQQDIRNLFSNSKNVHKFNHTLICANVCGDSRLSPGLFSVTVVSLETDLIPVSALSPQLSPKPDAEIAPQSQRSISTFPVQRLTTAPPPCTTIKKHLCSFNTQNAVVLCLLN